MAKIYLVDDHVMFRDALRGLLEAHGHEIVGEHADPTPALGDIARAGPDLLILDLVLGHRSGFELLEAMKRRDLRVPVVVATVSTQARHVADALRFGVEGYVLKGAPSTTLLTAIDAVLAGGQHYEGEVASLVVASQSLRDEARAMSSLSAREGQVISMVVRGCSSSEIAATLHLSPKTVDSYRSRLMAKLGVRDVPALVRFAIRAGLISADEA